MVDLGGARMIEVGSAIPERIFTIDRQMLRRYADASGDQNPIHQNEEFAKSVGLPNVIAHGMLTMALVGKFATDWSGGQMKEFFLRFTKPVIVAADRPAELVVSGIVTEVNGNEIKVDLNATSDGVKVIGMARAVLLKS